MNKVTQKGRKHLQLASNKRTVNSINEPKPAGSQEIRTSVNVPPETEDTPASKEKSPPRKKKTPSETPHVEIAQTVEATTAGAIEPINMVVENFAAVLRERAAAECYQMKKLDDILTEARNLESYLQEKKSHLRQTLALISDKLLA